ncbi:hypothetical protein VPHD480_0257 [Vibrio phage D480]
MKLDDALTLLFFALGCVLYKLRWLIIGCGIGYAIAGVLF